MDATQGNASWLDIAKLVVDAIGAILIPVVLLILGKLFSDRKKQSERAQRDADRLGTFLEHLSSYRAERRRLALLALSHLRDHGQFPASLLQAVRSIADRDNLEVAAAAHIALGEAGAARDDALVSELLMPMKVHFNRTRSAFEYWIKTPQGRPNERLEETIKENNILIRDLLIAKQHLIPDNLRDDARKLIQHYDAWLIEYDRVRPGGIRDPNVRYVFVGPKGVGFPRESEKRFMDLLDRLVGRS